MKTLALLIAFMISLAGCSQADQPAAESSRAAASDSADTIYINGKIYTVNEAQPWAEAVAISDGMFLVVGSNADVEPVTGEGTVVVDLDGQMAMPGLINTGIPQLRAASFPQLAKSDTRNG
jgi:adenine deaminase